VTDKPQAYHDLRFARVPARLGVVLRGSLFDGDGRPPTRAEEVSTPNLMSILGQRQEALINGRRRWTQRGQLPDRSSTITASLTALGHGWVVVILPPTPVTRCRAMSEARAGSSGAARASRAMIGMYLGLGCRRGFGPY